MSALRMPLSQGNRCGVLLAAVQVSNSFEKSVGFFLLLNSRFRHLSVRRLLELFGLLPFPPFPNLWMVGL
jgi:hypothetical protein